MIKIFTYLWLLSLFLLPFDNFPFIEAGFIKPLAIFPLSILFFLFLILVLSGKKKLRLGIVDLIFSFFILSIILNSLVQLIILPSDFIVKETNPSQRFIEIFYFLSLILVFYFVPRLFANTTKKIELTFKTIIMAFVFPLLWGILQTLYVFLNVSWHESFFRDIEKIFVSKGGIFTSRISMLTAEPSFAAIQIALFIFPTLFFCFYFKFSFFSKINSSVGKINIETILLALSVICFYMTFSVTAFVAMIIFFFLYFAFFLKKKRFYAIFSKAILAFFILFLIALPFSANFFMRADFFSKFSDYNIVSTLQSDQSFLVRSTGWAVGLKEFYLKPLFGVGMRNTMFYYSDLIPKWSQDDRAVKAYADSDYLSLVPTPKGFFPGIIGETGIIGLISFFFIYFLTIKKVIEIKPEKQIEKVIKNSSLFSLFSIIPLGLSIDFTYPYFWFILGMSLSVAEVYKKRKKTT